MVNKSQVSNEVNALFAYFATRNTSDEVIMSTLATTLVTCAEYATIPMHEITQKMLTAEKMLAMCKQAMR